MVLLVSAGVPVSALKTLQAFFSSPLQLSLDRAVALFLIHPVLCRDGDLNLPPCRVGADKTPVGKTFKTAELAREAQPSLWRNEAQNP